MNQDRAVEAADRLESLRSLLTSGDVQGAILGCEALLEAWPDDPQALGLLGLAHLRHQNIAAADESLGRALRLAPGDPALKNALGIVRMHQTEYPEAIRLFSECLDKQPYDRDALSNLATLYTAMGQPAKARPYLQRLVRLLPESADAHTRASDNHLALNSVEEAVQHGRKAVRLAPGLSQGRLSLADALEASGRFKQAKAQYLAILGNEEPNAIALAQLLSLRGTRISPEYLSDAQRLLNSVLADADRVRLHLGLARYLDSGGHFAEAYKHLEAGNDLRFRNHPFDSGLFTRSVDRLIEIHAAAAHTVEPRSDVRSNKPIFIVGMPRSGTTLVEQILASHSQVAAGGELSAIMNIVTEIGPGQLTPAESARYARRYLDRLESISTCAVRVTDKMPFNFMHLGLIAKLFPGATIIHCCRDPLDTCLSCYFTEFNEELAFASDLTALGRYWLDYRRLMQHWQMVLPVKILNLRYEKLVTQTEVSIRELLTHCGLRWEESCMGFHQHAGAVRTPSRWQVRQPIYRQSIGRWRNYAPQLAPLRHALAPYHDAEILQ